MLRRTRTTSMVSAAAFALILGACSSATETEQVADANSDPATEQATEIAETQAAPIEASRYTKAEIIANFEASAAKARATSGAGSPAMWTLADDDTTIHIFGTVHILRPELEWRTPAFDAALNEADKIVFEVDMKSEEAQKRLMTDFMARGMYDDGRTLRAVLNDEDEAVISAAFDSAGIPLDAMNAFEPWMASVNLGMMKMMADGFDPNSGVETVLEADATAQDMSFGYLETIKDQADVFDNLPEDDQITMLYETALMLDESSVMLDLLVDEWADGDVAGIGALVANPDGMGFTQEAYDALLANRNKKWVPQIEAMLEEPGTVFIAAGAGHFAGPDSVITMLRDKGYTVEGP